MAIIIGIILILLFIKYFKEIIQGAIGAIIGGGISSLIYLSMF